MFATLQMEWASFSDGISYSIALQCTLILAGLRIFTVSYGVHFEKRLARWTRMRFETDDIRSGGSAMFAHALSTPGVPRHAKCFAHSGLPDALNFPPKKICWRRFAVLSVYWLTAQLAVQKIGADRKEGAFSDCYGCLNGPPRLARHSSCCEQPPLQTAALTTSPRQVCRMPCYWRKLCRAFI